jgi:nucleoside-diphosphate-sugar epimerase
VTVLVTGAAGLLGEAVARRLHDAGRPVVAVDRRLPAEGRPAYPFHLAELDESHLIEVAAPLDAIVHCGAVSGAMLARDDPLLVVETNVGGTARVLELARRRKARRFVFSSSLMAYGPQPVPVLAEEAPLLPVNVYGASKAAAEALVQGYVAAHGLDAVVLRISHVYGPRRETECFVRAVIEGRLAGRPVRIPQAPTSKRQYVYVDDVAEALLRALDTPPRLQIAYNVAGGEEHTLAEMAAEAAAALGPVRVEFDPANDPPEYRVPRLDISAAERDLGFRPRVALRDGIARYARWLETRARPPAGR